MATPEWMKDVADTLVPDISGRKKAAAEAAKVKADSEKAKDEAAKAEAKKSKEDFDKSFKFKKGGVIDGCAQRGKTRGRIV